MPDTRPPQSVAESEGESPARDSLARQLKALAIHAWSGPWTPQRVAFAVALSLFLHVFVAYIFALIELRHPLMGVSPGLSEIPLAVVADSKLTEFQRIVPTAPAPTPAKELAQPQLPRIEDIVGPMTPADAMKMLAPGNLAETLGQGAGEDMVSVNEDELGGAGARFFGVEARGSRFAYLIDVSGSMEGDRLLAMKAELLQSVQQLYDSSQFTIVLFSSEALPLTGARWITATDRTKRDIEREIYAIRAFGGTDPLPGFDILFAMRPRPDAIYLMTDGQFAQGEEDKALARIATLNDRRGRRVPIHCISFVERTGEEILRRIAEQSGGTYTHVENAGP